MRKIWCLSLFKSTQMAWEHHTTATAAAEDNNLYRCVDQDENLPDHLMNTNIINCSGLQAHKLSATHLLASPDENRNPLNDSTGKFLFTCMFSPSSQYFHPSHHPLHFTIILFHYFACFIFPFMVDSFCRVTLCLVTLLQSPLHSL